MSDGHGDDGGRLAAIMSAIDRSLAEENLTYSETLTIIEMLVATIVAAQSKGDPARFAADIDRFCSFLRLVEITPLGDDEYAVGNRRRIGKDQDH